MSAGRPRLTGMDEWPRHQVATTFDAVASDSPHWSDGFYFTLGQESGALSLFTAIRLYPNTDVMDGYVCAASAGTQYNLRWSRRLRPAIDDLAVGPLRVAIVEPLQILRITCGPNPQGITYDLTWTGLHEPYLEDDVVRWSGGRLVYQRCNYDQCCVVTGWVDIRGTRFEVGEERWVGVRDHSWGLGRTGGPASPAIAPSAEPDPRRSFAVRQWAMFRLPGRVVFWQFQQRPDGTVSLFESRVLPADPAVAAWSYTDAAMDLHPVPGERRLATGLVTLTRPDGGTDRFHVEVVGDPVYLEGGGYHGGFDDGLGRGVYRGEDHGEGEDWDVSHPTRVIDPKGLFRPRSDAWAETFARITDLDDPASTGLGHLECVLAGPGFG